MRTDKLERNNQKLDAARPVENRTAIADKRAQYAKELIARFQAYTDWAIGNWPLNEAPLNTTSFAQSRDELNAICNALGIPSPDGDNADPSQPGAAQFVPVDPMPWP